MPTPKEHLFDIATSVRGAFGKNTKVEFDDATAPLQQLEAHLQQSSQDLEDFLRPLHEKTLSIVYQRGRYAAEKDASGYADGLHVLAYDVEQAAFWQGGRVKELVNKFVESLKTFEPTEHRTEDDYDYRSDVSRSGLDPKAAEQYWAWGYQQRLGQREAERTGLVQTLGELLKTESASGLKSSIVKLISDSRETGAYFGKWSSSIQPVRRPPPALEKFTSTDFVYGSDELSRGISLMFSREGNSDLYQKKRTVDYFKALVGVRTAKLEEISSEPRFADALSLVKDEHLNLSGAGAVEVVLQYQTAKRIDDPERSFGLEPHLLVESEKFAEIKRMAKSGVLEPLEQALDVENVTGFEL